MSPLPMIDPDAAPPAAVRFPHHGVSTRLGVSGIHGIGVFAVAPIAAGQNPFPNDRRAIRWVDAAVVEALPAGSAARQLYRDFGVRRGSRVGCPDSFDLLGTGWYVNEPLPGDDANLIADTALDLIAARDIAAGEELTVRYDTFSEPARQFHEETPTR